MSTGGSIATTLTRAQRVIRDKELGIRAPFCAEQLWEMCLSQDDRDRLGGDFSCAYERHGTAGMWAELRGVPWYRAVLDVIDKLGFFRDGEYEWLLREMGETLNVDEARSRAIAAGDFVLVERPREAHWDAERIDIDWDRFNILWVFLWELGRHGKADRPIDRFVFGENEHENAVADRKSRLTGMPEFPVDLGDRIVPVGRGTQQLRLPRERIRIFELSEIDTLSEWYP